MPPHFCTIRSGCIGAAGGACPRVPVAITICRMSEKGKRMNLKQIGILSLAAAVAAAPAAASAFDYSYAEGGYIYRDAYDQSGSGVRLAGSLAVLDNLAAFGELSTNDHLDQFGVGALFHSPLQRNLDFFGGASIEHADNGHDSDTGIGLRAGLRWVALPKLELAPEVRYVSALDGATSLRLNAVYDIAPHVMVQGAVQVGDDQRFELGLRYDFGGRR